jgi:hypothetical protein
VIRALTLAATGTGRLYDLPLDHDYMLFHRIDHFLEVFFFLSRLPVKHAPQVAQILLSSSVNRSDIISIGLWRLAGLVSGALKGGEYMSRKGAVEREYHPAKLLIGHFIENVVVDL